MAFTAVVVVLVSTILHASWNAQIHKMNNPDIVITLSYLIFGLACFPIAILDPPTEVIKFLIPSAAAQAIYMWMLGTAYREGSLGVAYPISRGTAPLLIGAGGWIFLNEVPSILTGVGLLALVAGLLTLAGLGQKIGEKKSVFTALISGFATVGYSLIDAGAVDQTNPLGYFSIVAIISATTVISCRRISLIDIRQAIPSGMLIGALQGGSYVLILLAFRWAQAGQVAGLRQLSIPLGVLLAGEALGRRSWWGVGLVAAGAALVVW